MTPLQAFAITAAAVGLHALLIPSCVQWNIGEKIRESAEIRVGADVTQRVYYGSVNKTLAPEVTYRTATPLITFLDGKEDLAVREVTPTGYLRVVSLPPIKGPRMSLPRRARTTVHERWQGEPPPGDDHDPGVALGYSPTADNSRWLGNAEQQRDDSYALKAALAAPFDYAIDPMLSTLSSVIVAPPVAFYLLLGVGYCVIMH